MCSEVRTSSHYRSLNYWQHVRTVTSSAHITSHLDGVTVDHHKYDAAGVCCTADTEVQEVLLQAGGQDEGLFTAGDNISLVTQALQQNSEV